MCFEHVHAVMLMATGSQGYRVDIQSQHEPTRLTASVVTGCFYPIFLLPGHHRSRQRYKRTRVQAQLSLAGPPIREWTLAQGSFLPHVHPSSRQQQESASKFLQVSEIVRMWLTRGGAGLGCKG